METLKLIWYLEKMAFKAYVFFMNSKQFERVDEISQVMFRE